MFAASNIALADAVTVGLISAMQSLLLLLPLDLMNWLSLLLTATVCVTAMILKPGWVAASKACCHRKCCSCTASVLAVP